MWLANACRALSRWRWSAHLRTVLGIAFGIWAATRQYSWVDNLLSTIAFLGMTIPRFLMALILVYLMVFHFDVSEIGSFFSPQYGGAPGRGANSSIWSAMSGRLSPSPSSGGWPTTCG